MRRWNYYRYLRWNMGHSRREAWSAAGYYARQAKLR